MSKGLQTAAMALGLTSICMAWLMAPLVSPRHIAVYHWSGSASLLFGSAFVAILIAWAVLALLLFPARRPGWWRTTVWMGILLYVPWIAVRTLYVLCQPRWPSLKAAVLVLLVWDLMVLVLTFTKRFERLAEFGSTVLMFLAISGALCLVEMGWSWWGARSLNRPLPLHHAQKAPADAPRPRILWIVLDELSYRQVYEHRYPGLELPAFDALAKEATVFTRTVPEAESTEDVLPALLIGRPVDDIRSSTDGHLKVHNQATHRWEPFNQYDTVFQHATAAGYGTSIAGWFNPYCRIMPAVLDHCYATWAYDSQHAMSPYGTLWSNLGSSLTVSLNRLPYLGLVSEHLIPRLQVFAQKRYWDAFDYQSISRMGDERLHDPSTSFLLLHLPVPHPPGIYNRHTGQLTTGPSTYIDNLALADKYLAHVRSVLEQSGQWDSSTVIVMGDHSWRTQQMWEHYSTWTEEEQRASDGGKFDDRPAYLVKLPGQQEGARIDTPFRALKTYDLLDALMAGKVRSADDLRAWVRQNGGEQAASSNEEKTNLHP